MTPFAAILRDHDRVRAFFDRFEELGPRHHRERREILGEIRREVAADRDLEREVLYPAARKAGIPDEAEEGHSIVDRLLAELAGLDAGDRRFSAVFAVLRENVEQHIREVERGILPELERRLDPGGQESLRRTIEQRRESARPASR
jgi:hypothetical protein